MFWRRGRVLLCFACSVLEGVVFLDELMQCFGGAWHLWRSPCSVLGGARSACAAFCNII